jgi:ATP-dependent RNA helicase HelY
LLLPLNDQCVPMNDPVTLILDRIQAGDLENAAVRYFLSRVRAGEAPEDAVGKAVVMVQRSFAAFKARQAQQEAEFEQKVEVLKTVLAENIASPEIVRIAASTGLADEPLLAVQAIFAANPAAIPTSVVGWIDWIVAFFDSDRDSYQSLLGEDADIVNYVVRGKKKGGPPAAAEFVSLNAGLRAWVKGNSFHDIEIALGAAADKVKCCPRARDLVLKLANRSLYLIASSPIRPTTCRSTAM